VSISLPNISDFFF